MTTETVDQYAQDLKKLFLRAYPPRQREAPGAETMAQSVIAYQFVDGLLPEIKFKLAGCKGTFEQPLSKAQFQEACLRDVAQTANTQPSSGAHTPKPTTPVSVVSGQGGRNKSKTTTNKSDRRCYTCEGTGHFA